MPSELEFVTKNMSDKADNLVYEGCNFFRLRLILSCISGKSVRFQNIRENEEEPGVKDFEVNFLRLIDRISNGSKIIVNETGTMVKFKPGILNGGRIEHTCPVTRSIGYFLEPLIAIAPFCKQPLNITFRGVTNNSKDPSVDMIRFSMIPVLKKFLVSDEGLLLKMERRGMPPGGGGVVHFKCPLRRSLKAFQWEEMGKVKKIRGVVFTSRVTPAIGNRIMESAKRVLTNYLSNVYFTCDNAKGSSPGYGACLMAETNKGSYFTAEVAKVQEKVVDAELDVPEDVGQKAAFSLLEEIHNAGCVDSLSQPFIVTLMILTPKDVSRIVVGPLTSYTMNLMKHIRDFLGVTFKIDPYKEKSLRIDDNEEELKLGAQKLLLTCVGIGYANVSKPQL